MRIFDRETFLTLPEGTLFASGEPWCFSGLKRKGSTALVTDFYEMDPCGIEAFDSGEMVERFEAMLKRGESYPMDSFAGREGLLDDSRLYLVFEMDDLEILRGWIDEAIANQELSQ